MLRWGVIFSYRSFFTIIPAVPKISSSLKSLFDMLIIYAIFADSVISKGLGKITATLEYRLSTFWQNSFFIEICAILPPTRQFGHKKRKCAGSNLGKGGSQTVF
jgi:hypothetical protein